MFFGGLQLQRFPDFEVSGKRDKNITPGFVTQIHVKWYTKQENAMCKKVVNYITFPGFK